MASVPSSRDRGVIEFREPKRREWCLMDEPLRIVGVRHRGSELPADSADRLKSAEDSPAIEHALVMMDKQTRAKGV
jgi:hypothetical protein